MKLKNITVEEEYQGTEGYKELIIEFDNGLKFSAELSEGLTVEEVLLRLALIKRRIIEKRFG